MKNEILKKSGLVRLIIVLIFSGTFAFAQTGYQKPPKEIEEILNATAALPFSSLSPTKDKVALFEVLYTPPISELAQPMLRLAGLRINPNNNSRSSQLYAVKLSLKDFRDSRETPIVFPDGAQLSSPLWSADGKYIAVKNKTLTGVELWIIDTATATAKKIDGVKVNTAYGGVIWMPDRKTLLVNLVPNNRTAAPPYQNLIPGSPNIQEGSGTGGAVQTFQDLLKSPNDEDLFTYYATSQLAAVGIDGKIEPIGAPAIFDEVNVSPDSHYILTTRTQKPYSYLFPASRFPKTREVWDISGKLIYKFDLSPLQDKLPVQGVPAGPRSLDWNPVEPATLVWAEALDGGDPNKKVTPRDKIVAFKAPFSGLPIQVANTEKRFDGYEFGEKDGSIFFYDYDRDTQHRRMFVTSFNNPRSMPRLIFDVNINDIYNAPGQLVTRLLPNGKRVIQQNGNSIFLAGAGASPEGDRPFLRKMNLQDLKIEELFRSGKDKYESFIALMNEEGTQFITQKESVNEPPNLYFNDNSKKIEPRQLTNFTDPTPQLRGITKQLVKYKRTDGVDLSFTLCLPPNYKPGTRLPTIVWAYPLEYTDQATAGQISGSVNRFSEIDSYSHLFFLLQGYAVLDNATIPIVGDPLTVNDTFIKQVVDSAKAAIEKATEMGVTDPDRVGIGGHSYGAFMTANLLAHSDLFRAGIARSGAYNRTLTPFGFQAERRTLWEAPETYIKVSPFMYADKIKAPILLIHGEADDNQGTFPIQSERLYAAIRGNGGTARLVILPLESHGYLAKESTEHVLWEMINWFDKYVKNAKPR